MPFDNGVVPCTSCVHWPAVIMPAEKPLVPASRPFAGGKANFAGQAAQLRPGARLR